MSNISKFRHTVENDYLEDFHMKYKTTSVAYFFQFVYLAVQNSSIGDGETWTDQKSWTFLKLFGFVLELFWNISGTFFEHF